MELEQPAAEPGHVEVDAAYWILWEWWQSHRGYPPDSNAVRRALVAAREARAHFAREMLRSHAAVNRPAPAAGPAPFD